MTTATLQPTRTRAAARFLLHYAEMSVAMMIGMMALAPVWRFVWPGSADVFEIHLAVMATNMAIGMAVPMLLRRHSWRAIAEMSAVMYVAFLAVLVPYWLGVAGTGFVVLWGHVLMFVAMFVLMLVRPMHGHH
ncbi:hypothetical protein ACQEVB_28155 [Pseudonocardia sp. CA-107938]|uniref:hypothetical protein n=1 Tax=Pseudonocardia sp. CA-107938 TaxID=3240021 RepID=UPI003D8AB807